MKISVAGYNVDAEQIKQAQPHVDTEITPEIISASYARISRDPRPIGEIRDDARSEVERARKSNEQIVFGVGHSSIAEHAVYNIDICGVSRYVVEEIQQSRLVSYTEKSQRYITLEDDFVIPEEILAAGLEKEYVGIIHQQNDLYHELYEALLPMVTHKYKNTIFDKQRVLEGLAKEDARYCVSLATEAQMGMTINARNLESLLVRLFSSECAESRSFARALYDEIKPITPSLVKYFEPTEYTRKVRDEFCHFAQQKVTEDGVSEDVKLISVSDGGDAIALASLLFVTSKMTYQRCCSVIKNMDDSAKEKLAKSLFTYMHAYDSVPREFENIQYLFELEMSATCFAQLKRHRMATILVQPYDPSLGVVVPESIFEIKKEKEFRKIITETESLHAEFSKKVGFCADYILTNAHKRRVLMQLNARELYHLSRLREDVHAQWDIRVLTQRMVAVAKEKTPLTLMLCTGKSGFEAMKDSLFQNH